MTENELYTVSCEGYQAVISSLGAELKSFSNTKTGENIIWSGDPEVWKGTAPILFPIVGRLKNGHYSYQGQSYCLDKHGFARTSAFKLISDKPEEKRFLLASSPESHRHYPFDFEFEVTFRISPKNLSVHYCVRNCGDDDLLFTLGSHPAFALPIDKHPLESYFLEFESKEHLDCYFLENDLLCSKPKPSFLNDQNRLTINSALFDNDALIFKNIKSRAISIHSTQTGKRLTLHTEQAPHLGIWAKAGAPFICLEPWFSFDDTHDSQGELAKKPGIMTLEQGQEFNTAYRIELYS